MKLTDKINAYNVDCMDFMKNVPDNYYELAIVDPPYGIADLIVLGGEKSRMKMLTGKFAKWDLRPDKKYFDELYRVSKNQIIWGANYFVEFIPASRGWITWDKMQPAAMRYSKTELNNLLNKSVCIEWVIHCDYYYFHNFYSP